MSTLKRSKCNFLNINPDDNIVKIAFVILPLLLSAFTHIWNPVGSPSIHDDEGHYIRRALHVTEGLGAQEERRGYDHPYFGWLFLGSMFNIIGYPDSLSPRLGDVHSIEELWSVPRTLMGIIAVVDTFLVYTIAEIRYNRKIAFIAAVLFAVMPASWYTRSVFLESIQLPLILLSILFAVIYKKSYNYKLTSEDGTYYNLLLLSSLSGIFLGLAIFTKIPAFTFIPLLAFLIVEGDKRINQASKRITVNRLRFLILWFIPVILVPTLWLVYAISADDYDKFIEGINFQMSRSSKPLLDSLQLFYSTDPILLILGISGIAFCAAKREFLFLVWIVPFMLFLYILDYASYFFLIPIIPALCIASAVMISDSVDAIFKRRKRIKQILPFAAVSAVGAFGLVSTTALIMSQENSSYVIAAAAATHYLPNSSPVSSAGNITQNTLNYDGGLTVIASPKLYWIIQYVFDKHEYDYRTQFSLISMKTLNNILEGSEKVLMVADPGILEIISNEREPDNERAKLRAERLSEIYNNTELAVKLDKIEIRKNY